MSKESMIMQMIKGDYSIIGLDAQNTYKKTDILLRLYRKINWGLCDSINDLNYITYESCMGDNESLSYLLNFAPDKELDVFRARAINVMQTRVLIELIDKAIIKIKDYPDNGTIFYSIFDLKYLNRWTYTEDDILEMLELERSTFYRKKKEAILLLGYILFGFIMPEYIEKKSQDFATKMRQYCD